MASSLTADHLQKQKGLRRSGAAVSKKKLWIKGAAQKFSEGSFVPACLADEGRGHSRPWF